MSEQTTMAALVEHWRYEGSDYDRSHLVYAEDAVLEFPQSGERFVGRDAFLTWRKEYPANVEFRIRRMTHHGDLWVNEGLIRYDGGPWNFTINVLTLRDGLIAYEALYVMEGWPAAEFRAPYATVFDPLASIAPADWAPGLAFGITHAPVTGP
jgi:hypothetical protein